MALTRLTDEQMRSFIRNGYVAVKTGHPREFHQDIWNQTERLFDEEGNPGNNLIARNPRHTPNTRRSGRRRRAGKVCWATTTSFTRTATATIGLPTAKDSRFTETPSPSGRHRTRWLLAMYYPQDTTVEMGPTGVLPGSHYFNWLRGPDRP